MNRIALMAAVILSLASCVRAGKVCAEGSYQCRFDVVEQCQDDFWVAQETCRDDERCDIAEGVAFCEPLD